MIICSGYITKEKMRPRAEIEIFPLFVERLSSPCMVKHSMEVVKVAIEFLNSGQTPVIDMEQPLHSLAKEIQWQYS